MEQVSITTYVERIHDVEAPDLKDIPSLKAVEASPTRCPHPETASLMEERVLEAKKNGDSVGGSILCRVNGLPIGWGSPVFDRLEADLAKAMLSLPATKGFEVGSGFKGTFLKGSEHNDLFENRDGKVRTKSNLSGGVQGGISNGEELYFRVAFKPTATVLKPQQTVDEEGNNTELIGRGRHDPCVLPRAVPIVEAMTALVLIDHRMLHHAQCESFPFHG
jgi:chorismate synthase